MSKSNHFEERIYFEYYEKYPRRYSGRHKIWAQTKKYILLRKMGDLRKTYENFIKQMNLYFVNVFQRKFSCYFILYLLII